MLKKGFVLFIFFFVLISVGLMLFMEEAKSVVHPPYEDGDCIFCHDLSKLDRPNMLVEEVPELCATCHDPIGRMNVVHPPVAGGECISCHNPHESDYPRMLIENVPELCAMCHDPIGTMKVVHPPVDDGECTSCHNPH